MQAPTGPLNRAKDLKRKVITEKNNIAPTDTHTLFLNKIKSFTFYRLYNHSYHCKYTWIN